MTRIMPADAAQTSGALACQTQHWPTGINNPAIYVTLPVKSYSVFQNTITINCNNKLSEKPCADSGPRAVSLHHLRTRTVARHVEAVGDCLSQHADSCFSSYPGYIISYNTTHDDAGELKFWPKLLNFSMNKASSAAGQVLRALYNLKPLENKLVYFVVMAPLTAKCHWARAL